MAPIPSVHLILTSICTEKTAQSAADAEVDQLLDEVIGENDSSISSMDVSEDESSKPEENTKKRRREEVEEEEDEEHETILYVAELESFAFL